MRVDENGNKLFDKAFPDMESIELGQMNLDIERNRLLEKRLVFPSTRSVANLYSGIMVNFKGEYKAIEKAKTNIRRERIRPESDYKSTDEGLNLNYT